ncbi:hypothetical protein P154DRAFT_328491 [Amniculicola lignicola CBS 123094]|uniref:Heterokaryon incompatibility domain-containing protein n=1 Tax=Amniculicola lignicola CBS 123094 TaxID=1392246 RepID=A0A6A5WA02_9PLEO|nr:hypothetical protein P154DRAFT_328491 [Amniculicola lignicola CBS 123094]
MDLIYQRSEVNVIDASGHDSNSGLPGVLTGSRSPNQPFVSIAHYDMLCAIGRPQYWIDNSPWSTRGWTYQEGFLSWRRLIFTSQQGYLECQGMHCIEALNSPPPARLSQLRTISKLKRRRAMSLKRIFVYSKRTLSHDADIINDMLGLIRFTERLPYPLRHLRGLPFMEIP